MRLPGQKPTTAAPIPPTMVLMAKVLDSTNGNNPTLRAVENVIHTIAHNVNNAVEDYLILHGLPIQAGCDRNAPDRGCVLNQLKLAQDAIRTLYDQLKQTA